MSSPELLAVHDDVLFSRRVSHCPEGLACSQWSWCMHMAVPHVQGLQDGLPMFRLGLAFLPAVHSVCTGDLGTLQRQMYLWVDQRLFSLLPQLIHRHSLVVWLHVTARCSCGSHTRRQESACSLHWEEEKNRACPLDS